MRPTRERIEALLKEHTKWPETENCPGCLPRFVPRGDCEEAAILTLALEADTYRQAMEKVLGVTTAHIELQKAIKARDTTAANMYMSIIKGADAILLDALGSAHSPSHGGRPGCDHTWIAVKYRGVATGELCTKCHSAQDSPEKTRESPS